MFCEGTGRVVSLDLGMSCTEQSLESGQISPVTVRGLVGLRAKDYRISSLVRFEFNVLQQKSFSLTF